MTCVDRVDGAQTARNPPEIEQMLACLAAATTIPATYKQAISGLLEASQDNGIAGAAGCNITPARFADLRAIFASMELPDGSGQLSNDRIYLKMPPFDVKLQRTDEGLVCDICDADGIEGLASCYAFNEDAEPSG